MSREEEGIAGKNPPALTGHLILCFSDIPIF